MESLTVTAADSRYNLEIKYNNQWISEQYSAGLFGTENELQETFKSSFGYERYKNQLVNIFEHDSEMKNDLTLSDMKKLAGIVANYVIERM